MKDRENGLSVMMTGVRQKKKKLTAGKKLDLREKQRGGEELGQLRRERCTLRLKRTSKRRQGEVVKNRLAKNWPNPFIKLQMYTKETVISCWAKKKLLKYKDEDGEPIKKSHAKDPC